MAGNRGKGAVSVGRPVWGKRVVSVGQLVGGKGQSLDEPPSYNRVHMY